MAKLIVLLAICAGASAQYSAVDLVRNVYGECLSRYSIECVKPRALEWMSQVAADDEIHITKDLSFIRNGEDVEEESVDPRLMMDPSYAMLDGVERFLSTHSLRVRVPAEVSDSEAAGLVPRSLLSDLPAELTLPLDDEAEDVEESRSKKIKKKLKKFRKHGFIKKVLIPFLLGLKFKASVLVPLALALIALKTWKALTLGLISLVLSGAMVIFKFTKPKVVNYEVIHYPQHHVEHHVDHHVDHAPAWDGHHGHGPYQARSLPEPHTLAYSAYLQ